MSKIKYLLITVLLVGCGQQDKRNVNCINKGEQCHDKEDPTDRQLPSDSGIPGPIGPVGPRGSQGETGSPGKDGSSCQITSTPTGATIRCGESEAVIQNGQDGADGKDGVDGKDGQDATSPYTVTEVIDPCGKQAAYDEVLLRMANGKLLAHFASGNKQFLTTIGPGTYSTTDGTSCLFTVHADMSVTY